MGDLWKGVTGRGIGTSGSSACKITASRSLALSLEIAVNGIVAVILHRVGVPTHTVLEDWSTVSSGSTSIVYSFLED